MKIILISIFLLLSGCGGWVHESDIKIYESLCAANGGIRYVAKWWSTTLYCKNGASFEEGILIKARDIKS